MTKIIFGINVPYQSRKIDFEATDAKRKELEKDGRFVSFIEYRVTRPVIRYKDLSFELCDICGSQVPPGRASRGITTCCPKCNAKKWDVKNGLIIEKEKAACGIRPTSFWLTISYECFKRDKFTCQHCGKTKEQLEQDRKAEPYGIDHILNCHHIKPIKSGGNNQLDNLITLCSKCHKIEHSHARNVARKHRPLLTD